MLILYAKLLSTIAIPLLLLILWQRYSKATWSLTGFALAEAAITMTAMRVAQPYLSYHPFFLTDAALMGERWDVGVLTLPLVYGFIRLLPPLLIFLFVAKDMRSWKEAVFYGIARTLFAIPISYGVQIYRIFWRITYAQQEPPDPQQSEFISVLQTIKELPTFRTVDELNFIYTWERLVYEVTFTNFTIIALSIAIATALLYAVRHKKMWPLAAALACYYLMVESPLKLSETPAVITAIRDTPLLGSILANLHYNTIALIFRYTPSLLASVPSALLAIHIRKRMSDTHIPQT